MARLLLNLALVLALVVALTICLFFPEQVTGPKKNMGLQKPITTKTLDFPFSFLDTVMVYSDATLEVKKNTTSTTYRFGKLEMIAYANGNYGVKHFSLKPEAFTEGGFIAACVDRIEVEDTRLLIEQQYKTKVFIDSNFVEPHMKMAPLMRNFMNTIGYLPPEIFDVQFIRITTDCKLHGVGESVPAFYSNDGTRNMITFDSSNTSQIFSSYFCHEWGHHLVATTLERDSTWWIGIAGGDNYTKDWNNFPSDSALTGFVRQYSKEEWGEDIATCFEIFHPGAFRSIMARIPDDPTLAKKVRATIGLTPIVVDSTNSLEFCNSCAYLSDFRTLAFIPKINADYGHFFTAQYWNDLQSYQVTSTRETGWYWERRKSKILKQNDPLAPKQAWWEF
ncbi:MAG: hypothetical protein RL023_250 [Candidatus Parcubacteria bacterium]|jgi:hypothetical protein